MNSYDFSDDFLERIVACAISDDFCEERIIDLGLIELCPLIPCGETDCRDYHNFDTFGDDATWPLIPSPEGDDVWLNFRNYETFGVECLVPLSDVYNA